jgi:hypothetical protein
MDKKTDLIFGEMAMRLGVINKDQLDECANLQEKNPRDKNLSAILVEKGYLSTEQNSLIRRLQVEESLRHDPATTIKCPKCHTSYNFVLFNIGSKIICWKCDTEIIIPPYR